jgi:membrane protease YdiL (CAAX protease family)
MNDRRALYVFFGLTFMLTWGIGIVALLFPSQVEAIFGPFSEGNPLFFLAVFSPSLSSLFLTWLIEGRDGLWELVHRLGRWRFNAFFYFFVLIVVPTLGYLAAVLGGRGSELKLHYWYMYLPLLFSRVFIDPGPLGEELGWRGYALPRLLQRYDALKSSFILGILWGLWHLPAVFCSGLPQQGVYIMAFILGGIALSVLSTWLYNSTGGSILITAILHLTTNFSLVIIGAPIWIFMGLLAGVAFLVIVVTGPAKLSRNPAVTKWGEGLLEHGRIASPS